MIFKETKLKGSFLITPDRKEDARGYFSRSFCRNEFAEQGLAVTIVQTDVSYNEKKGTFRGMHFQAAPFEEDKIVTCTHGAFLDIIVDLRTSSPTYLQSVQVELSEENGHSLFVPKSFAHGFFTLLDSSRGLYLMTQYHHPECERGFRYNDPAVTIQLPFAISNISERDETYPDLIRNFHLNDLQPAAHHRRKYL